MASSISAGTTSATALVHTADTSGALQLATNNGTVAVTIDTSQNVGIGTASPQAKLDLRTAALGTALQLSDDTNYGANFIGVSGGVKLAMNGSQTFAIFQSTNERMRIDSSGNLQFNSGYGSVATAYGCRAWVNFDGTTASPSTIRGSGNVTSVTKNSTGDYTVNLTTAMPDTNGVVVGASVETIGAFTGGQRVVMPSFASTSTIRVGVTFQNGGSVDMPYVGISAFR